MDKGRSTKFSESLKNKRYSTLIKMLSEFIVTDGTTHDIKVAPKLLSRIPLDTMDYVSADKRCNSEIL